MKILIINPPIRLADKPRHIPHGLGILASLVRKKLGVVPTFLDINSKRYSDDQVRQKLEEVEFDVVLIGGLIPVYKRIVVYADMIKSINPNVMIIAGGSAAMSVPELLLKNSKVDAVCLGEGEEAIVELFSNIRDGKGIESVKGFCFKKDGKIVNTGAPELLGDLDAESDLPAYDLLQMDIYLSNPVVGFGRDIDFISSRGCPYQCTFCYQPWGRKFRAHSAQFIVTAIAGLRERYGVDFISFQDDEFMADKRRVRAFCDLLTKTVPGMLWSCTGRVNCVDDEIVAIMRDAGCVSISYGFESGSTRILKSMKKNVTIQQMENAIRVNRKYGMMLPVSFIIGMPGENDESCRETVEFCVRNELPLKSMMYATPYPGTELFNYALKTGRIRESQIHEFVIRLEDARDFVVNLTDDFTDEELMAKRSEMIEEVGSRVTPISVEECDRRLQNLFGEIYSNGSVDSSTSKHRAEHGGIDIF